MASAYKKIYAKQAEILCTLGATDAQMAEFFGVATSTFYLWKKKHKALSEALKAKDYPDEEVVKTLLQKALSGDTTAMIFWLKNRRPVEWRDRRELAVGNASAPFAVFIGDSEDGAQT